MYLNIIKEKLLEAKNTTIKFSKNIISNWATKLQESSLTISKIDDLEKFVEKSRNYYNDVMKKEVTKKVIVIFAPKNSDFYKKALYILPVIYTKAWTTNIDVRMSDSWIEWLDLNKYAVLELPSLVYFENEKVEKIVAGEEKINKIVKGLTLNVESTILAV